MSSNDEIQFGDGNVEEFKDFLSRPRRLKTLVFAVYYRHDVTEYTGARPKSERVYEFKPHYFHAAVDGENFFMRGIESPSDYLRKRRRVFGHAPPFVGRYGGRCFYVETGLIIEDFLPDLPGSQPPPPGAEPSRRALPSLKNLDLAMNLGLHDVSLNSFVWDPRSPPCLATRIETFKGSRGRSTLLTETWSSQKAKGETTVSPEVRLNLFMQPIEGSIEIARNRVEKAVIRGSPYTILYEYSESNPLPKGLPNKMVGSANGELINRMEIFIIEEVFAPIEESYFRPDPYVEQGHYRTIFSGRGVQIADASESKEYYQSMREYDESRPKDER